jgi:hypothetical protein
MSGIVKGLGQVWMFQKKSYKFSTVFRIFSQNRHLGVCSDDIMVGGWRSQAFCTVFTIHRKMIVAAFADIAYSGRILGVEYVPNPRLLGILYVRKRYHRHDFPEEIRIFTL